MAVRSFATNNLVKDHDMYVEFMKRRWAYIKEEGGEPTDILFCKKGLVSEILGLKWAGNNKSKSTAKLTVATNNIKKWHSITIAYDIWCNLARYYIDKKDHNHILYKKFVDMPSSVLNQFKFQFKQSVKKAGCEYKTNGNTNSADPCRLLAVFWTYLELAKDCKTQRFFPNNETRERAVRIFGYKDGEDPFKLNGTFMKNAVYKEEEKPVEEKKMPGNIVDILETRIEDLGLTMRSRNALVRNGGCKTVGDIVVMNIRKMLKIRNLGLGSIKEIVTKLKEFGIEYKTEPNGSLNWDELPFVPKKEESVIDIAEEAAKRVEEEAKLEPNKEESKYEHVEFSYDFKDKAITPNKLRPEESVINISRNEYEEFMGLKKKHDELLKTAQEQADKYDELLKQKLELDACNARLKDQVKSSTDIIATFHKGIELMRQHGISDLSTNINGFSVDIKQKLDYSIRTRPSNQKFLG